ncbi:MAG: TetR/AcrR family transcriptional regulator [Chitinophagaceae bacterium]|nr:TetR/AcrR family transcriptional regulator [Chitinophagaceae bacterium]
MARLKEFDENEVLDKAIGLFWAKGYNGTSAQDLTECLGISRSSLYHTFNDKRTLFVMALKRHKYESVAVMCNMFKESDNVYETFKRIFQTTVAESMDCKAPKGCFLVNCAVELAPHDEEIAEIVRGNFRDVEELFSTAIKKGQEAGQISKKLNARSQGRIIFNILTGIRVAARSGADKKVLDDIIRNMLLSLQ